MAAIYASTIGNPEFINVKPYNPLISECEIKVLYLGENRNHSYISKETAMEMANTLPGCPIVGHFKKEINDFGEHDKTIEINSDGIHLKCETVPYGFVAPNAKIWFQKFEEIDETGKSAIREYLMTTGFLWTGQFPECEEVVKGNGKRHSMELDEDSLHGDWTKQYNSKMKLFIINDAIFSKLCILGSKEEPCFEGSTITDLQIAKEFSLEDKFTRTLFSMMQELKDALEQGGQTKMAEIILENQDKTEQSNSLENDINTDDSSSVDFAKEKEKDEEQSDKSKEQESDESDSEKEDKENESGKDKENKEEDEDEEKKDKSKKDYSLLEVQYAQLESNYYDLQAEVSRLQDALSALQEFKLKVDNEKKDALINSFYMLSDEDKQDVIANKANYSLDDIESKLSVICVRKKVSFDSEEETADNGITTYSLNEPTSTIPAWVAAVRNNKNSKNC